MGAVLIPFSCPPVGCPGHDRCWSAENLMAHGVQPMGRYAPVAGVGRPAPGLGQVDVGAIVGGVGTIVGGVAQVASTLIARHEGRRALRRQQRMLSQQIAEQQAQRQHEWDVLVAKARLAEQGIYVDGGNGSMLVGVGPILPWLLIGGAALWVAS